MRRADAQTRRRAVALAGLAALWLVAGCAGDKRKRIVVNAPPPETVYVKKPVLTPRVPPLPVSPARVDLAAIGDTSLLTVPQGAQCASASDSVARIDSSFVVTGLANGDTHIRCWQDGQTATIKVHVQQQVSHVLVVADRALEMARSGDSIRLQLNQTDRRGIPMAAGAVPQWTSITPGLVTVDPATGVATSVADSGTGKVVGQAEGYADTVLIPIGAKGAANKLLSRITNSDNARARALAAARQRNAVITQGSGAIGPVNPVQSQVGGQTLIGARAPQLTDSLFRDPSILSGLQRLLLLNGTGYIAERQTIPDTNVGLQHYSGALFGGGLDIMTRGPLSFRFQFATGTLTGDTSVSQLLRSVSVSEGSFDACLAIAPWLTVVGGSEARVYTTTASTEQWRMIRFGGEAAFNLGGGPLYGYASALVMPLISVANDQSAVTAPTFGLEAGLGVGMETPRLSAKVLYDIEHFSFPSTTGHKEQFAELVFRFGYKFAW